MSQLSKLTFILVLFSVLVSHTYADGQPKAKTINKEEFAHELEDMRSALLEGKCKAQCETSKVKAACTTTCIETETKKASQKDADQKDSILSGKPVKSL